MHAEAFPRRGDDDDLLMPVLMALALHAGLVALMILAGWWQPLPKQVSVAGPVVEAALVVSTADIAQALATAEQAPKPAPPEPVQAEPIPQPLPEPMPQDSPVEPQPAPQEAIPEPDTVEQEAIARLALEREQAREREEREARIQQAQIDLTERERQQEAERRQRRREQLDAIRREREEAARQARIAADRLQQLEDARAAPPPQPDPSPDDTPAVRAGNNGTDSDLLSRYVLAMHQTADASWNRSLAPEATPCKVRFTQIPGGEVIDVEFLSCPFNGAARESVERALRRGSMPYDGFESVFERTVDLTFCHPQEACP